MRKVAAALNKGLPSSFYSRDDQRDDSNNPVLLSFEQELQRFFSSVTKRSNACFRPDPKEPCSKMWVMKMSWFKTSLQNITGIMWWGKRTTWRKCVDEEIRGCMVLDQGCMQGCMVLDCCAWTTGNMCLAGLLACCVWCCVMLTSRTLSNYDDDDVDDERDEDDQLIM